MGTRPSTSSNTATSSCSSPLVGCEDYQLATLSFRTGHPRCKVLPGGVNAGPNCSISNRWQGRAVDITATAPAEQQLQAVSSHNASARAITEALALMDLDQPLRPDEVGSPWAAYEDYHGHFTNSLHQDHLHIGYRANAPEPILMEKSDG